MDDSNNVTPTHIVLFPFYAVKIDRISLRGVFLSNNKKHLRRTVTGLLFVNFIIS